MTLSCSVFGIAPGTDLNTVSIEQLQRLRESLGRNGCFAASQAIADEVDAILANEKLLASSSLKRE